MRLTLRRRAMIAVLVSLPVGFLALLVGGQIAHQMNGQVQVDEA